MSSGWSAMVVVWAVGAAAAFAEPVTFKSIDRGQQSGIEEAREVVVRTAAEWTTLWKEHAPTRDKPVVDFKQSMVVGVFLGSRPTGGHRVDIASIERDGADLTVTYRERKPSTSDIVTQVITMPYQLVTLPQSSGKVRFVHAN